jgi:hypothetical protein
MTTEILVVALGIAISVAQLVPLFTKPERQRPKIVAGFTVALVIMIVALIWNDRLTYRRTVESAKSEILNRLDTPKPFEQIFLDSFYRDFHAMNQAMDELVEGGMITHRRANVTAPTGETYEVRIYSRVQ